MRSANVGVHKQNIRSALTSAPAPNAVEMLLMEHRFAGKVRFNELAMTVIPTLNSAISISPEGACND